VKIDYCTLDQLRYSPKTGKWYKGRTTYEFRDACATCGESFLTLTRKESVVCSRKCRVGELNNGYKDGRDSDPAHRAARDAAWHRAHRDERRAYHRAHRAERVARSAAWRKENPGRVKVYYQETKAEHLAKVAKRRARKLNQTPPDASQVMIQWLYKAARLMSEATGEPFHVDHIHPLAAGGPHHQDNLQLLPAAVNISKNAKVGVDPTGPTVSAMNSLLVANGVSPYRRLQIRQTK
jgi:hypothetical protein